MEKENMKKSADRKYEKKEVEKMINYKLVDSYMTIDGEPIVYNNKKINQKINIIK